MTDQANKQNAGKPPVYQGCFAYFPRALKEVARVSEFGATKYMAPYTRQGWRQVPLDELRDAIARHELDRVISGEVNHKDGDMLHQAQIAWEALAALEVMLVEREKLKKVSALLGGITVYDKTLGFCAPSIQLQKQENDK